MAGDKKRSYSYELPGSLELPGKGEVRVVSSKHGVVSSKHGIIEHLGIDWGAEPSRTLGSAHSLEALRAALTAATMRVMFVPSTHMEKLDDEEVVKAEQRSPAMIRMQQALAATKPSFGEQEETEADRFLKQVSKDLWASVLPKETT